MQGCEYCELTKEGSLNNLIIANDHAMSFVYDELREGQCMVVPKAHRKSISELDADEFAAITELIGKISRALEKKYAAEKTYLLCISDKLEHIHFHLIPKHRDKISMGAYCFRKLIEAEGTRHPLKTELSMLIGDIRELIEGEA